MLAPATAPVCDDVTKSQIETVVGHLLSHETQEFTRQACIRTFFSDDVEVSISVQHLMQSIDIPADLRNLEQSTPDSKLWEVKGMAGRAFALDIPGNGLQLHVFPDAGDYLLVSVQGLTAGDHGYQAAIEIAQALISRRQL